MEQAGREARKKNAATNGGMAWKATLRWHGGPGWIGLFQRRFIGSREMDVAVAWSMRGGGGAKNGGGGPRADLGVRPTKTTLLRQAQAGIAVQHMKMALFDEGGVGGGQDIEIIDAGERK